MFDIAPTELLVLGGVALLVIPPKDLPRAMRTAGYWMGRARGVARQFRSGFDTMLRESELHEMEKRWAEENARIMREHPVAQMQQALDAPPVSAATPGPVPAVPDAAPAADGAVPSRPDAAPDVVVGAGPHA